MSGRIEVIRDEITERIDELAELCYAWQRLRQNENCASRTRHAIIMASRDIAALAEGITMHGVTS